MNESLHDALERIINICQQQFGLVTGDVPIDSVQALHNIVRDATAGQRAIRAQDTHNEC